MEILIAAYPEKTMYMTTFGFMSTLGGGVLVWSGSFWNRNLYINVTITSFQPLGKISALRDLLLNYMPLTLRVYNENVTQVFARITMNQSISALT